MQDTQLAAKTGEVTLERAEKKTAGDYEIAYRVGPAKGLYEFSAGKLEWKEPQEENAHLDVLVTDAADGRQVSGLHVEATLLDRKGARAAANHLPYVWDPQENHYGSNVNVPESGTYMLQVHIYPATFPRTDKERGERYVADTHVQFEDVRIDV